MTLNVGLTGGIGCGKSTAVDAFRELGVSIIDADQIAKEIVKPGKIALKEIVETFGKEILLDNGAINRERLKGVVFRDSPDGSKAMERLEKILHPKIRLEIKKQLSELMTQPYVIVDIPLLVEKNYQEMFDRIVVVDCLPEQQIERVRQRDGMSEIKVHQIMHTQASREERKKVATDILDNSGDKKSLLKQIKILHSKFLRLSKH